MRVSYHWDQVSFHSARRGRSRSCTTPTPTTSASAPSGTTTSTPTRLVQVARRRDISVTLRPEGSVVVYDAVHRVSVVNGVVAASVAASATTRGAVQHATASARLEAIVALQGSKATTATARRKVATRSTILLASESTTVRTL
jgi:hypothetical protein